MLRAPHYLNRYKPPSASVWTNRVRIDSREDADAFRLHQVVQRISIDKEDLPRGGGTACALLGFCCDAGVRANGGTKGAAKGPEAIRGKLANLPVPERAPLLVDAGDIVFREDAKESSLLRTQVALADGVEVLRRGGMIPIVLGGGHEQAFGVGRGLWEAQGGIGGHRAIGVVNFDAHFDLRPLEERGITSGTPFRQLALWCQEEGLPFQYLCLGIQHASNTQRLFKDADLLGARHVFADEMDERNEKRVLATVNKFLKETEAIHLTIDLDVFAAAYAPGVSALNVDGLAPNPFFYRLFDRIVQSGKVIGLDIAELCPKLDPDGRTAQLAARLVHRFLSKIL